MCFPSLVVIATLYDNVREIVMILMLIKVIMMITMSGHFIVKLVVRGREAGEAPQCIGKTHVFTPLMVSLNFSPIPVHAVVLILMIMKVIMMIITMSGHFIEKLVVRKREVGKMLQRIGKAHVSRP